MVKIVILVSGKRYSGKDTAVEFIEGAKPLALADAVRMEYLAEHNDSGIVYEDLTDRVRKEQHRSGIIALSEGRKKTHGKSYWVRKLYEDYIRNGTGAFVISDWRFIEEYNYFMDIVDDDIVVVTLRINATLETRKNRGLVYNSNVDESIGETGLDDFEFDYVIENNETLDALKMQIERIK